MEEHRCIMLIRHAEKPAGDLPGVDVEGRPDERSLSLRGWQRAGALVRLFMPIAGSGAVPHLQVPRRLVAARATEAASSTRPRDTLRPLAEATGLAIDEQWSADDPLADVARHLRDLAEPVLVCWRHDTLPALARELLQRDEVPSRWPDDRFDLVWVIERRNLSWTFAQAAQQVLAGDSVQPVRRRVRMG